MLSTILNKLPPLDSMISEFDKALKTITANAPARRSNPSSRMVASDALSDADKASVIEMMRINHVGEICAQALYQAQALATQEPEKKRLFTNSALEEGDHLAWTRERLNELGGKPSLLNPMWYAGAFALGFGAGQFGEKISLGFMAETEKQVEQHLDTHLDRLPVQDSKSRAILEQMKQDEIEHGQSAMAHGAGKLPLPVKLAMKGMSKIMTTLARKI